jgi:ribonuclease T2
MNEHDYFNAALQLYGYDITTALSDAGIVPDGSQYKIDDIRQAMSSVLNGHLPGIECNKDESGNKQLYQVYICVDTDGSTLIDCPVLPSDECKGSAEFPVFDPSSESSLRSAI